MRTLLTNSTVVVVAHDVNMSIFNLAWLAKSGFLRDEELAGEVVVSPVLIRVPTDGFELVLVPNRIQMDFPGPSIGPAAEIDRVVAGIVKTLPHTPYSACGLNFNYLARVGDEEFGAWSQRQFASEAGAKLGAVGHSDSRFGSYSSFDVLGGRLKLDIKPTRTNQGVSAISKDWTDGIEVMRLNFNFNYQFEAKGAESPASALLATLSKWADAAAYSQKLVSSLPE